MSSTDLVAKRYAGALFGAAEESKTLEEVAQYFSQFSALFQEMPRDICQVLLDPTVSKEILRSCISTLLKKAPKIIQNFCDILVQEGRLNFVVEINHHFQGLLRYSKGESVANVWSARELPKTFCGEIEKILSHTFDRKVSLQTYKNPELLEALLLRQKACAWMPRF